MLGLLLTKWDSIVVVDHVVISEVGHCTAIALSPPQGFFFSVIDIHVGVDGCGDGEKKEQELSLDEAWQSGEVGHGYWPCTQKE